MSECTFNPKINKNSRKILSENTCAEKRSTNTKIYNKKSGGGKGPSAHSKSRLGTVKCKGIPVKKGRKVKIRNVEGRGK